METAKVLMIDDEPIVLIAYSRELEEGGCVVQTAETPQRALEMVKRSSFDIAYVDMRMPEMDGVKLCEGLKSIAPEMEVVLLSGQPDDIELKQMDFIKAGGRDELLRKPLLENELLEVTQKLFQEILQKKEN